MGIVNDYLITFSSYRPRNWYTINYIPETNLTLVKESEGVLGTYALADPEAYQFPSPESCCHL